MVMVMAMMSREPKPATMLPSQDGANTMTEDFTEIPMSNSERNLDLVWVMSARLDGQMRDFPEAEMWRRVSFWMYRQFSSLLYTSYFITSYDLDPGPMASA